MKTTPLQESLKSLTELEIAALRSAYESSDGNGHDFGFTDDIEIEGKSKRAVGGVISSLLKKGVMDRYDDFKQFCFGTNWDDSRYTAAEAIEAHLKSLDAPQPELDKVAVKRARRAARRAARKAAKSIL